MELHTWSPPRQITWPPLRSLSFPRRLAHRCGLTLLLWSARHTLPRTEQQRRYDNERDRARRADADLLRAHRLPLD